MRREGSEGDARGGRHFCRCSSRSLAGGARARAWFREAHGTAGLRPAAPPLCAQQGRARPQELAAAAEAVAAEEPRAAWLGGLTNHEDAFQALYCMLLALHAAAAAAAGGPGASGAPDGSPRAPPPPQAGGASSLDIRPGGAGEPEGRVPAGEPMRKLQCRHATDERGAQVGPGDSGGASDRAAGEGARGPAEGREGAVCGAAVAAGWAWEVGAALARAARALLRAPLQPLLGNLLAQVLRPDPTHVLACGARGGWHAGAARLCSLQTPAVLSALPDFALHGAGRPLSCAPMPMTRHDQRSGGHGVSRTAAPPATLAPHGHPHDISLLMACLATQTACARRARCYASGRRGWGSRSARPPSLQRSAARTTPATRPCRCSRHTLSRAALTASSSQTSDPGSCGCGAAPCSHAVLLHVHGRACAALVAAASVVTALVTTAASKANAAQRPFAYFTDHCILHVAKQQNPARRHAMADATMCASVKFWRQRTCQAVACHLASSPRNEARHMNPRPALCCPVKSDRSTSPYAPCRRCRCPCCS